MTDTPTPEAVAALETVTLAIDGDNDAYIVNHLGDNLVALPARDEHYRIMHPEVWRVMVDRFNTHEALAADRDAQKARADAMQRSYDELYADALADARSDAQEFEGDLWKLLRDYLTELNLDWSDYTEDGITAEQAIEHIRECMDGETVRADAAEAQLKAVLDREAETQRRHDAKIEAAEAKVARLVEAIDYILDGMDIDAPDYEIDPDDDFLDAANSDWVRDVLTRLAAAIAEVQA